MGSACVPVFDGHAVGGCIGQHQVLPGPAGKHIRGRDTCRKGHAVRIGGASVVLFDSVAAIARLEQIGVVSGTAGQVIVPGLAIDPVAYAGARKRLAG